MYDMMQWGDGMTASRWRNWALVFMFGGFFVIYCGVYNRVLLPYLLAVGSIGVVMGILIYFRFGPVNPTVKHVQCPRCGQQTRLTGTVDACSNCQQKMRLTESGTYEPYAE